MTAIRNTPEAPDVRHPVNCGGAIVVLAFTGAGGEKTQPTGTWLEDVVVDDVEDVSLLELEVVDEGVELLEAAAVELWLVELDEWEEVVWEPRELRMAPTPTATTITAMTATAAVVLPIAPRELVYIGSYDEGLRYLRRLIAILTSSSSAANWRWRPWESRRRHERGVRVA
ncbi:MAG TPA: hypothetical protein VND41_05015 [Nitrososphaerales archaeon]|nr:hypothetical protein [Nitrososphaerales archaeon]